MNHHANSIYTESLLAKHNTVSLQVVHPVTMEKKVLTYSINGLQSALSETNYLLSVH